MGAGIFMKQTTTATPCRHKSLLALAVIGAMTTTMVHADLGATVTQLEGKYGQAKRTSLDAADEGAGGAEELTFYTPTARVNAVVVDGKCANVIYFTKTDGAAFTEAEVAKFFSDNGGGASWQEIGGGNVPTHVTEDESRCAVVKEGNVGFFTMAYWRLLMKQIQGG